MTGQLCSYYRIENKMKAGHTLPLSRSDHALSVSGRGSPAKGFWPCPELSSSTLYWRADCAGAI